MKGMTPLRRQQLLSVLLGLMMGAAAWSISRSEIIPEEGIYLKRNPAGQGQAVYPLMVSGADFEDMPLDVVLEEKVRTWEEARRVYDQILEELPELILKENLSFGDVRSDLNLLTSIDDLGVSLKWQSEDPERIDSFGEVHTQGLEESGTEVLLNLRLNDGTWSVEHVIPVCVKPAVLTPEEQRQEAIKELINASEKAHRTEETFALPAQLGDHGLEYKSREKSQIWLLPLLGAAGAVLLELKEKEDLKKRDKERKQQLLLDYSEVLSRLIILLGAGMSIRTAWNKIAEEGHPQRMDKKGKRRYVYEEMYTTSCQLKSGVSEGKALEDFGRRCGLPSYVKLCSLLEQNRKNGSGNLRDTLKIEMADAFEQRKQQARRLGEEAGTKLLIPLFLLLSVVMVMIAVPALIGFGAG